ncbi:hypothetical protein VTO73DRAFT_6928 [Trametes versicolor]
MSSRDSSVAPDVDRTHRAYPRNSTEWSDAFREAYICKKPGVVLKACLLKQAPLLRLQRPGIDAMTLS